MTATDPKRTCVSLFNESQFLDIRTDMASKKLKRYALVSEIISAAFVVDSLIFVALRR